MKLKAVLLLFLFLTAACFAQTFMIVATEIRDGEERTCSRIHFPMQHPGTTTGRS